MCMYFNKMVGENICKLLRRNVLWKCRGVGGMQVLAGSHVRVLSIAAYTCVGMFHNKRK